MTVTKREALRLVTSGGRDYTDAKYTARVLKYYQRLAQKKDQVLVVVQGGARGSDTEVRNWCKASGVPCFTLDAQWEFFGNSAGPIRNGWMIEFWFPTHGFVFPGHKGTADMKAKMIDAGIKVKTHEDFND